MILEGNKLSAFHSLLASTVDYAGLFPPAGLDMEDALQEYRRARATAERWLLGSFVVSRTRLPELEAAAEPLLPGPDAGSWSLSVVLDDTDGDLAEEFEALRQRWTQRMVVAAVEVPPCSREEIEATAAAVPGDVVAFFEVPLDETMERRLEVVASTGSEAKIRLGGVVPKAFPPVSQVADFMLTCKRLGVPFKATAGLHHPMRGPQQVVPGRGEAICWMHGFLNVTIAAVLLSVGAIADDELVEVLSESEASAFSFSHGRIVWRDREVTIEQIERARRSFFSSFGSCSFREPVDDLSTLGLLDRQSVFEPV